MDTEGKKGHDSFLPLKLIVSTLSSVVIVSLGLCFAGVTEEMCLCPDTSRCTENGKWLFNCFKSFNTHSLLTASRYADMSPDVIFFDKSSQFIDSVINPGQI